MNTGKEFERFVRDYYVHIQDSFGHQAKIKLDEEILGPHGERQCDIVIDHSHLGVQYRTIIECKDLSRRVSIEQVDAFVSKLYDLQGNKGIMVSRSGFQSGAIEKAKSRGIDLYSFADAKRAVHELDLRVPVLHLVMEVSELSLVFNASPDLEPPLKGLSPGLSREMGVRTFISKYLRPSHRVLKGTGFINVAPEVPLTLESRKDYPGNLIVFQDHEMTDIKAYARFSTNAYLGRLEQVNSFYIKQNQITGAQEAYIPHDSIGNLSKDLALFADTGEVPLYLFEGGFVTFSIDMRKEMPRRGLFELEQVRQVFEKNYDGLGRPSGKWLAVYATEDAYD